MTNWWTGEQALSPLTSLPVFALEMGFSAAKSRLTPIAHAAGEISGGFHPLELCDGFSTVWSRAQMRLNMNRFRGICAVRVQNAPESAPGRHVFSAGRIASPIGGFTAIARRAYRRGGFRAKLIAFAPRRRFRKRRVHAACSANRLPRPFKTSVCFSAFRPKSVLYQKDRSLRHGGLRSFFDVCQRTSSSGSTHSLAR